MIRINGREVNLDSLRVKVERRRARGLLRGKEWPARSLKEELQRMPELEPRSHFGIQYRLQRALALHGARLEPPLSPAGGFVARLPGLKSLGMLAAKLRRRLVTAPNEGYVAQQEQFNSHIVAGLEAVSRIHHELQWEVDGRLTPPLIRSEETEELDEAAVEGLMKIPQGRLTFLGLPGVSCMERLLEKGRLEGGIDFDDRLVAEYQASFLPARWAQPKDLPLEVQTKGMGALVLMASDRLTCEELDELLGVVASLGEGSSGAEGTFLLVRVSKEGWTCPPGFARVPDLRGRPCWTAEFLTWMMERHGLQVEPSPTGNAFFLMGKPAKNGAVFADQTAGEEGEAERVGGGGATGRKAPKGGGVTGPVTRGQGFFEEESGESMREAKTEKRGTSGREADASGGWEA